jgi:hypothetical protein
MTDKDLHACFDEADRYLRNAARVRTRGDTVVDGARCSPANRAIPGVEEVYRYGTPDQWDSLVWALDDLLRDLGLVWRDGTLILQADNQQESTDD